ncbi:efflux RND transporter periplasmic adaptor subunit [Vitreoscilla massiliensis]|uniref:Efflux RND transporter periplasmic adaptor subunit n=1 Tax=Vitreoscilla massiliensis TaxID=1689272 RepID=A0ABY4DXA5_9NEIS|nr:efflux RND transporter periplasmic adaptor subunit [Vitreoscilla massiliensis]UOO88151.1 efflux RND transporter periplasmic adaptor subunit [Vitreoscilla massiliensis]
MCALLLVLAACGKNDNAAKSPQVVSKQLSAADVLTVQAQDFAQVVAFTGSLKPIKEATVSAESGGTVSNVLVDEGNAVEAGQVVAVLDNQSVRESLQAQRAQVQNSQANLDLAATKLKQQQVLFGKGFVSKLALEQAQNEYKVALGSHKAQQAELAKLNKNQADAQVRAPISGVVYDKLVNNGELVNAGGQILKIAQTKVLEIAATVSAEQVTFVKVGQEVSFTVATGAPVQTGHIVRINPVADASTRQFTVFIHVPNANGDLKAGQFAQGNIVLNRVAQALVVPETAIHQADGKEFVYVVSQGKLNKRPVTSVLKDATTARVAVEGLQAGDAVLRTELLGIKVGDTVKLPVAEK